jgi:hypothetical protein
MAKRRSLGDVVRMMLLTTVAMAAQLAFKATNEEDMRHLAWSWKGKDGAHTAEVDLPAMLVATQDAAPLRYPYDGCAAYTQSAIVRAAAANRVKLRDLSVGTRCGVHYVLEGPSSILARAMASVRAAGEAARAAYREEQGFVLVDGKLRRNHAALMKEVAIDLAPLADALSETGDDARSFADRALGFVQSIPYEAFDELGGFRLPLSVLSQNRGDCDSKSVLFLALMEAAFPEVPTAMVLVPDHAYVAIGIYGEIADERVLLPDGSDWPIAEPVGPALKRVGEASARSTDPTDLQIIQMP